MTARAHRIEVDRCGDCPFWRFAAHGGLVTWCRHPESRFRFGKPSQDPPSTQRNEAPPAWCPLRGSVTMIAGPKVDEGVSRPEPSLSPGTHEATRRGCVCPKAGCPLHGRTLQLEEDFCGCCNLPWPGHLTEDEACGLLCPDCVEVGGV